MYEVLSSKITVTQEGDGWDKKIIKTSEGQVAATIVDKIFANDRVAKFDNGQLVFGTVAINRKTLEVRIEWDDGYDEDLEKNDHDGSVAFTYKMGILDRKSVGYGSKVTNGRKLGTVREKHFLVTVILENDHNTILKDIPCEALKRSGYSRNDDKIVYNNEWVGLVVNTKAKLYFKMDKDGKTGKVSDESYGMKFPHPGQKIKNIPIAHLWDADWGPNSGHWFWNLLKYLADAATILRTEIDCITVAWMGRIGEENPLEEGDITPPNTIRYDQMNKVKHLYGRNWKYVREYDTWDYEVQKEDSFMTYADWTKDLTENFFFGLNDKSIDMESLSGDEPIEIDSVVKLEPGTRTYVKIVMWRSVLDIEWDDGSFETVPSYAVKPSYQEISVGPFEEIVAGDIVNDKREPKGTSKYGYVINTMSNNGEVKIKWVTPDVHGGQPKVSSLCDVSRYDIELNQDYLYLRSLHNLPVVVCKSKGCSVDGVNVGIAVGISVENTKIVVKCDDEKERLVWAHDFVHFNGDVLKSAAQNKWIPWI